MPVVVNKHNTARVAFCWFIIYYRLVRHGNSNIKYTNRCNASSVPALLTEGYNFSKYVKPRTELYLHEVKNEWIYAFTPPYAFMACIGIAFPLGIT